MKDKIFNRLKKEEKLDDKIVSKIMSKQKKNLPISLNEHIMCILSETLRTNISFDHVFGFQDAANEIENLLKNKK